MLKKVLFLTLMIFLFSLTVFTDQWVPMSGSAKDVGISSDGAVWVIGTNKVFGGFGIYRWAIDRWEQMPGGAVRIGIGSNKEIWVVNNKDKIFKWSPGKKNWEQKPGSAKDIGVGVDGAVWVIGTKREGDGYGIYKWTGSNWEKNPGNAKRISVGSSQEIWVVNNKGKIFKWSPRMNNWEPKPGTAGDIGVGADGTVWIIGTKAENGGYCIYEWTGSDWGKKPGTAVQISVGSIKHILASNKSDNIFLWQKGTFSDSKGDLKALDWCYKFNNSKTKITFYPIISNVGPSKWLSAKKGQYYIGVTLHTVTSQENYILNLLLDKYDKKSLSGGVTVDFHPNNTYIFKGWGFAHPDDTNLKNNHFHPSMKPFKGKSFEKGGEMFKKNCLE